EPHPHRRRRRLRRGPLRARRRPPPAPGRAPRSQHRLRLHADRARRLRRQLRRVRRQGAVREAYQEPTARTLYGGWTGAGSDPTLEPERSRTIEVGGSYAQPCVSSSITTYYVHTTNAIEVGSNFDGTSYARNIGTRDVVGLEASAQALL